MRQLVIPRTGPPGVVRVREVPDPEPGPGTVRVRVRAAGLNFADVMTRQGLYPDAPPLPAVMGYEVAGEIDRVGDGVGDRAPGQWDGAVRVEDGELLEIEGYRFELPDRMLPQGGWRMSTRVERIIREEGLSAILVEQNAKKILGVTDRAAIIERGSIVHQAASSTLATDAAVLEKYLGVTQSERVVAGRRPAKPAS